MRDSRFFTTINYTSVNEDWRTELRALQIRKNDRILCVAGSGDRPLNLLIDDPETVVAIDRNGSQINLLQLKMAALGVLSYQDYVGFLGLTDHPCRTETWRCVADGLSKNTRSFWAENLAAIGKGILYQGRWERYYRNLSRFVSLFRREVIETLFDLKNLDTQLEYVRLTWDKKWWRTMFNIMCDPIFSRIFFGDPAFYANVPRTFVVGPYLYQGMIKILERYVARENFMLALLFRGRLLHTDLPPYLSEKHTERIRDRIARIVTTQADLLEFLETCEPKSFTKFSLSDTPSFLNQQGFERLLDGVVRTAAPGARICIRQFLTGHTIPERFRDRIYREPRLEQELANSDRAFSYRFIVGQVCP